MIDPFACAVHEVPTHAIRGIGASATAGPEVTKSGRLDRVFQRVVAMNGVPH